MAEAGARPHADVRIAGDGFLLRAWRQEDLEALLRHADDPQVPRGLSDRFPHPYTRADGEAFLAGRVVDFRHPVFAIEIDGEACGGIAVRPHAGERAHGAELGYWLGRQHWVRVEANVLDTNPASVRVLEKNGFAEEGCRRAAIRKPDGLHDVRLFGRVGPG